MEAEEGDRVVLPCRRDPPANVSGNTVEWRGAGRKIAGLYRHGKDDPDPQSEQYRNRTKFNHKDLSRGILNLEMFPVQLSDSGSYKCSIPKQTDGCVVILNVVKKQQNRTETRDPSTKTPAVENETRPDDKREDVGPIVGVVCALLFILIATGVLTVRSVRGRKVQQTETVAHGSEHEELNSKAAEGAENPKSPAENGVRIIVTTEV